MKMIFVTIRPESKATGGDVINKRNLLALRSALDGAVHDVNTVRVSTLTNIINMLRGYVCYLSPAYKKMIFSLIEKKSVSHVFLGTSRMGKLAREIKKKYPNVQISVFFHNAEKQYMEELYRVEKKFKIKIHQLLVNYNEKLAVKYGDRLIVLNQRDDELLKKYYKRGADLLLPTSFMDLYDEEKAQKAKKDPSILTMLFVGSAFYGNTEGVSWFIKEVLPKTRNTRLVIVGKDMDKHFLPSEKLDVYGYVDDLSHFYYMADIVVLPILSGGGMKTKTAEAMMYAKPILGTKEAFEGYDIDTQKIGYMTGRTDEMIEFISSIQQNRAVLNGFSHYSRNCFLESYSFEHTVELLYDFYRN